MHIAHNNAMFSKQAPGNFLPYTDVFPFDFSNHPPEFQGKYDPKTFQALKAKLKAAGRCTMCRDPVSGPGLTEGHHKECQVGHRAHDRLGKGGRAPQR